MKLVRVPSFAKINLDLRVLHKRPDGFHELRTIFQTISLHDTLVIEFKIQKRTQIVIDSSIEIKDNIVLRAAQAVLDHLKVTAWVRFVLDKRIPMGAGLGGGSSNAAATLFALPALAGKRIYVEDWVRIAELLGSDVPFFLYGGTALGLGRGSELYPLPDLPSLPAVIVASGIHVSTAEAYRALNRPAAFRFDSQNRPNSLTLQAESPILREFQTVTWTLNQSNLDRLPLKNDFQEPVFATHRELAALERKLRRLGANPAAMTGSGSALFGIFRTAEKAKSAAAQFPASVASAVRFVSRRKYQAVWRRALGAALPGFLGD